MISEIYLPRLFEDFEEKEVLKFSLSELPPSPSDLDNEIKKFFYSGIYKWEDLENVKCLILLGEPGYGKTFEFEYRHKQYKVKNANILTFLGYFKDWNGDILDTFKLSEKEKWKEWYDFKDGNQKRVYLFLDGLDEALEENSLVIKKLNGQLYQLKKRNKLPYLRISCRISEWDKEIREILLEIYEDIKIVKLLGLGKEQILQFVEKNGIDKNLFWEEIIKYNAFYFATHPLLLKELIKIFRNTQSLPSSKTEIYEIIVKNLLNEYNEIRRSRYIPQLSIKEKEKIAQYIACLTIFSGKELIRLNGAISYDPLKEIDFYEIEEETSKKCEIFNTALFIGDKPNCVRFYHRSIAEFLAAKALKEALETKRLTLNRINRLFRGNSQKNVIISHLRGVAGWLATFNQEFRNYWLEKDFKIAGNIDFKILPIEEKEKFLKFLITQYKDYEYFNESWLNNEYFYSSFAEDKLTQLFREVLENKNKYGSHIRKIVLEIILYGKFTSLLDSVLEIVLNNKENINLRSTAIRIIGKFGNKNQKLSLKNLLPLAKSLDPEDELLGEILDALFPEILRREELIKYLKPPQKRNYFGKYHLFLHYQLPEKASVEDCEFIINYLVSKNLENFDEDIVNLYVSLLVKILKNKSESISSEVLLTWSKFLEEALNKGIILRGTQLKNLKQWFDSNPKIREKLIKSWIIEIVKSQGDIFSLFHSQLVNDILNIQDDELKYFLISVIEENSIFRKNLFELLIKLYGWEPDLFEKLIERFPELKTIWDKWSKVELGSKKAEELKNYYYQRARKKEEREYQKKQKIEKEKEIQNYIKNNLEKIAKGDPNLLFYLFHQKEKFKDLGKELEEAYNKGLYEFWKNTKVTFDYFKEGDKIPNSALIICEAVTTLWQQGKDFSKIEENLIYKALISALYNISLPEWFENLSLSFPKITKEVIKTALEVEIRSEKEFSSILYHVLQIENKELLDLIIPIITENLQTNEDKWSLNNLKYALKIINLSSPDLKFISWCKKKGKEYWKKGEKEKAFYFLVYWFIKGKDVENSWLFLKQKCFTNTKEAKKNIILFLNILKNIFYKDWIQISIPPKIFTEFIELLFQYLPPEKDPERGGVYTPDALDKAIEARNILLNNLLTTPASWVAEFLQKKEKESKNSQEKSKWRWYLEKWEENIIHIWKPLKPEEVKKVIFEGYYKLGTPEDFFELVCELMQEVKELFETDEFSLAPLLYENYEKPREEKYLQIAIANQLKLLLKNLKILTVREPVLIKSKPDIRISVFLESGIESRINIETKPQYNCKIYEAIETQLIKKYLQEPETQYGIYIVGWFNNKVRSFKRKKPKTPEELEKLLKAHVKDLLPKYCDKIKNIEVFVINLQKALKT